MAGARVRRQLVAYAHRGPLAARTRRRDRASIDSTNPDCPQSAQPEALTASEKNQLSHVEPVVTLNFASWFESQRVDKNVARVDALQFPVLEFDQEDTRQAGEARAHLASKGIPIGPYDVLIAGQAKARKLTLVTHNTTEFQRVPGLKVEDWKGATSSPSAGSRLQRSQAKPRSE
jgi:predicted nucleic acid-binding protein